MVDGTGSKGLKANIGIKEDRIICISTESLNGKKKLEASELVAAPGFIDVHSHGDLLPLLTEDYRLSRLRQGITSEIVGQCGVSILPVAKKGMEDYQEYIKPIVGDIGNKWDFEDLDSYVKVIKGKMPHNMGFLIGLSTLRSNVCGFEEKALNPREIAKMTDLYEKELKAGALGLSLGLSYLPGVFANKEELLALARITKKYDRIIMAHIRSHGLNMLAAIDEFVQLGRETGVRIHISHCRSYGYDKYGQPAQIILNKLAEYRSEGIRLTVDQHPYANGSTFLNQLFPPQYRDYTTYGDKGILKKIESIITDENYQLEGWDNFLLMVGYENILVPAYGLDLLSMAKKEGKRPFDKLVEILIKEKGNTAMVVKKMFLEEDITKLLRDPDTFIGSDGLPSGDNPHPRLFGAFPKIISKYVRELKVLTLEEAVYKMTGDDLLEKRGKIKAGYHADIVLFSLEEFSHKEDYLNKNLEPTGIKAVIVNGQVAYLTGKYQGDHGVAIRG